MIDILLVVLIGIAVFFILKRELRRLKKGQCSGGCAGCCGDCDIK